MAASPVLLNPSPVLDRAPRSISPSRPSHSGLRSAWIPVLCAIGFVCFTSTAFMGGMHTQVVVNDVWHALFGKWHWDLTGKVNGDGRKVGHFFGYGMIGIIFARAWTSSLRTRARALGGNLVLMATTLGILSTATLASLDEWHQCFLPGRVGSVHDVLLDTCGAICLNLCVLAYRSRKQNQRASEERQTADEQCESAYESIAA
ncbi:MAG TPA: VanZ family protein [Acidobacteriaceae bacterium]|nr:VanZ family protein [Acidobacteriaceae bacterium]